MVRTTGSFARGAFTALLLTVAPLSSVYAQESSEVFSSHSELDPGEYVWKPELSPTGDVEMVVSIPLQVAYVYRGGTLIGMSTVSTGKPGNDTPTGSFPILQKKVKHTSNLYNAPMPYMQRLTWDGIALHSGEIPGYPASHGCVRLPNAFAKQLYSATRLGATVTIIDEAPGTPHEALAIASSAGAMASFAGR
jgi:hypothetical protein